MQFFPNIDPFGGSRLRATDRINALGSTLTPLSQTIDPITNATWYQAYLDDPFTATTFLDAATNQEFASWGELFGPNADYGDLFTNVQRDNLNNILFDAIATDETDDFPNGITPFGFGNRPATYTSPPFAAEDIILLTDGLCSSACSIFTESMSHEANVRTVVVGGQPQPGPMQGVAGTRGARSFDSLILDGDILVAQILNSSLVDILPGRYSGIYIDTFIFNLQDQIRRDEYFPL